MTTFAHALAFAATAHAGQVRKYTGEPYVYHPMAVAATLIAEGYADDSTAVLAALLHDVLEDTDATPDQIDAEFGPAVLRYLLFLTDPPKNYGNRAQRKAMTAERLAGAPPDVHSIKVADLLDNTPSIVAHDPRFATVFLDEKGALLEVLGKADAALLARARNLLKLSAGLLLALVKAREELACGSVNSAAERISHAIERVTGGAAC